MSLVHSSDLLGTAGVAMTSAYSTLTAVRDGEPMRPLDDLRFVEAKLVQALAEVRAAAWGISRRNPGFDDTDLELLLDKEAEVIRASAGTGFIPRMGVEGGA